MWSVLQKEREKEEGGKEGKKEGRQDGRDRGRQEGRRRKERRKEGSKQASRRKSFAVRLNLSFTYDHSLVSWLPSFTQNIITMTSALHNWGTVALCAFLCFYLEVLCRTANELFFLSGAGLHSSTLYATFLVKSLFMGWPQQLAGLTGCLSCLVPENCEKNEYSDTEDPHLIRVTQA